MEIKNCTIDHRTRAYELTGDAATKAADVRAKAKEFGYALAALPDGRTKAVAVTRLEEALFWAIACLERNQE